MEKIKKLDFLYNIIYYIKWRSRHPELENPKERKSVMFETLTIEEQREAIKNWKKPLTIPTAVCFPYLEVGENILDWLFLPAERLKGTLAGNIQLHHGGVVDATDPNVRSAAWRELLKETGFDAPTLQRVGMLGPLLPKATMGFVGSEFVVNATGEPANPRHPYIFNIYVADVTGLIADERDGEIKLHEWTTLKEVVEKWGKSGKFNYPPLLAMAISYLKGNQWDENLVFTPGTHRFRI